MSCHSTIFCPIYPWLPLVKCLLKKRESAADFIFALIRCIQHSIPKAQQKNKKTKRGGGGVAVAPETTDYCWEATVPFYFQCLVTKSEIRSDTEKA